MNIPSILAYTWARLRLSGKTCRSHTMADAMLPQQLKKLWTLSFVRIAVSLLAKIGRNVASLLAMVDDAG